MWGFFKRFILFLSYTSVIMSVHGRAGTIRSPGTGVLGNFEPPDMGPGTQTQVDCKNMTHLTTEPSP